jgi:hypothetical protein
MRTNVNYVVEVRLMVNCDQAPAGARVIRNGSNVIFTVIT